MNDEQKTIIEINGVKLEVDLRTAKRIDNMRVGDRVKCLVKEYQSYKALPGVIVGFEPFKSLPTIIVAALELGYSSAAMKFFYVNAESKDIEIVASIDNDLPIDKAEVLSSFNREIQKKREEIAEIERRRDWFESNFKQYFMNQSEQK